jgi:cholesterol oxidase
LTGVGVGGGSLVYANTLPVPKTKFFTADTWSHLANWEKELKPFYPVALQMLGATKNTRLEYGDEALRTLSKQIGKEEHFESTDVAVYFGEPGVTVKDPFFNGKGPDRTGCIFCGGCMLGCRHNAKNTLDKNYLYFAQKLGTTILAESEVVDVKPLDGKNGVTGYMVYWKSSTSFIKQKGSATAKGIIFAGGVLGTVKLLLKLKKSSLPNLSDKIGSGVRTNSESLLGVTAYDKKTVFSDGIAIGSILHTDENSHLEPVRYPEGAGFWRILMSPVAHGRFWFIRMTKAIWNILTHPVKNSRVYFVSDWAKHTQILLFMQTINTTLRFSRGIFGLGSSIEKGKNPTAFIPEAKMLAEKFAEITNGKTTALLTETIFGIPTTAHILGGCVMGKDINEGVIDKDNQVFGYENMMICDGSMISANPGVNPSLTITALSERAMSKIPAKSAFIHHKNGYEKI